MAQMLSMKGVTQATETALAIKSMPKYPALLQIVPCTQPRALQTATIICSFNSITFRLDKILVEGDLSSHEDVEIFKQAYFKYMGVPATDHLQAEVTVCHANIIWFFVGK